MQSRANKEKEFEEFKNESNHRTVSNCGTKLRRECSKVCLYLKIGADNLLSGTRRGKQHQVGHANSLNSSNSLNAFFLGFFGAILILSTPSRSQAISVDRSEEELRSMPLASATPNAARLPTAEVNQQLARVLTAPEYAWQNPSKVEAPPSWLEQFNDWLKDSVASFARALGRLERAISSWLSSLFPHISGIPTGNSDGMSVVAQVLSWVTIIGAAAVLTLILAKIISRRRAVTPPAAPALAPIPDLESEDTTADQLPEDEWLWLARQKAEEGDLRQALRALFLAVLSLLGAQGLILIRKSKSNFDYERELRRKPDSGPHLDEIFSADRKLFERCWYGAHPVTIAEFEQSDSLYQRLKHVCLRRNGQR